MRALLFNPENDLALAAEAARARSSGRYTPPKGALAVATAGALLPLWWAGDDDAVLLPEGIPEARVQQFVEEAARLRDLYGLKGHPAWGTQLRNSLADADPFPWGWSSYARQRFTDAGVGAARLPGDEWIGMIREFSHRRHAIGINRFLAAALERSGGNSLSVVADRVTFPPPATEARRFEEIQAYFRQTGATQIVVKLPWSCSSRGVVIIGRDEVPALRGRLEGMIRRQGSVTVEKYLSSPVSAEEETQPLSRDFAALFEADGNGRIRFRAWSAFSTDAAGRYRGNIVAPQEEILSQTGLPGPTAAWLASQLEKALEEELRPLPYRGWIGIDMLRWDPADGTVGIAPCIEMNLRMTMGVAAYLISLHTGTSAPLPRHIGDFAPSASN